MRAARPDRLNTFRMEQPEVELGVLLTQVVVDLDDFCREWRTSHGHVQRSELIGLSLTVHRNADAEWQRQLPRVHMFAEERKAGRRRRRQDERSQQDRNDGEDGQPGCAGERHGGPP